MSVAQKMIKILPKVEEKTLSMELRETHFVGENQKNNKKCC